MPPNPETVVAVFSEAFQITSLQERAAFLKRVCGDDATLRRRVEALLEAADQADGFLEGPALHLATGTKRVDDAPGSRSDGQASASLAAGTTVGPYHLLRVIGEGGMGTVYLAEQLEPLRRQVAVKVMRQGADSAAFSRRFEAGRQALALMDHPNIAKVLDAGTLPAGAPGGGPGQGTPYFVMEYVDGIPITQYCDEQRLTIRQRLELLIRVCYAVAHAHQKGVIHRDLKPSNILVGQVDGQPAAKVIDFGVAKAIGQPLCDRPAVTATGVLVGTLEYMSPEQAALNPCDIDTRSDIYSLGVVLYELITGNTPLPREKLKQANIYEALRWLREEDPPKPSTRLDAANRGLAAVSELRRVDPGQLARMVRGDLDWLVMKALDKDRARRYDSAGNFARDLERYLNDEPIAARPPSRLYRLRKFARKHRTAVAAAVLLVVTLTAATAVSTGLALWANQERARAVHAENQGRAERDAAETARQAAVAAEADTRAFSDFLVNQVLAAARPEGVQGGLGVSVTVAQALTAAEKNLEAAFAGRPKAEALTRQALGVTFRHIGDYPRAERNLRRAVELWEEELGPEASQTLDALHSLGVLLCSQGDYAGAVAAHQRCLEARQKHLGTSHVAVIHSMHELAVAFRKSGRLAQALPLYEEALRRMKLVRGEDAPFFLGMMGNFATALTECGRVDQAIPLLADLSKDLRERFGAAHDRTLNAMSQLAGAYLGADQPEAAIPLFEEVLPTRGQALGQDHPEVLKTLNSLGLAYHLAGRSQEALPLLEQAVNRRKARGEELHPNAIVAALEALGHCHWTRKDFAAARRCYEDALARRTRAQGAEHPDTLRALHNVAAQERELKDWNAAAERLRKVLDGRSKVLGPRHADTLEVCDDLSLIYLMQGNHAAREALLMELVAAERELEPPNEAYLANRLWNLGIHYLAQNQLPRAEQALDECLKLRSRLTPQEPATFLTQTALGDALLKQCKHAAAEPLLLAGYEGLARTASSLGAAGRTYRDDAGKRILRLYETWPQPDKLELWRKRLREDP